MPKKEKAHLSGGPIPNVVLRRLGWRRMTYADTSEAAARDLYEERDARLRDIDHQGTA